MRHESLRTDQGTAAVEFAIVLPILLLLLVGLLEWGRYFVVRESVVHAAREGARGGTLLDATESDACAAAMNFLTAAHISATCPGSISVDMTANVEGGSGPMPAVGVRIEVPFTTLTRLPLAVPATIQVEAVMPTWRPAAGGT